MAPKPARATTPSGQIERNANHPFLVIAPEGQGGAGSSTAWSPDDPPDAFAFELYAVPQGGSAHLYGSLTNLGDLPIRFEPSLTVEVRVFRALGGGRVFWGEPDIHRPEVTSLDPEEAVTFETTFPLDHYGHYELEGEVKVAGGVLKVA
ncbi:MAG: hypothetical protein ACRDQ2_05205 [Gaiellales bacterium]